MDFFNESQILGLVLFAVGVFLLNLCAKLERKDYMELRDPKIKWELIDKDEKRVSQMRIKSARGWAMTLIGIGMALYGSVIFFMNI